MAETLEAFAQRLLELRKQKNLSQTAPGQLTGLHYTRIWRCERGAPRPGGDPLKRLSNALGQQQIEAIARLPTTQQHFLAQIPDTLPAQQSRQDAQGAGR